MPGETLLQVHIPKTGGTTLFDALERRIGSDRTWLVTTDPVDRRELAAREGSIDLVAGHLTWAAVGAFPTPPRVLTVLRDPIERALSHYSYLRENVRSGIFGPGALASAQEAASGSMSELLRRRATTLRPLVGPVQVGFLSSDGDSLRLDTGELMPGGELDAPAVERALTIASRNLDACWWVATTETLERDLETLADRMGWPPFQPLPPINATRDRLGVGDLSPAARRELERLTEADRVLHARARALADERYAMLLDVRHGGLEGG